MNKTYLTALFIPLLLAGGCVSIDANGCASAHVTLKAKDDGKAGSGGGTSYIQVRPDTKNVKKGCPLVVRNPNGHLIHTTSTEAWLNQTTPTKGEITMGNAEGNNGDVFKYTIHVDKIGKLDPRARVTN
jgi:hypothetical protein